MLPKNYRVVSPLVFQKILEQGEQRESQYFKIFFKENNEDVSRFAVIINSKICPSAVERNLMKRRIRNIVREAIPSLPSGFDVLIFVKKDCLETPFQALKKQLEEFLMKILRN